MNFLTINGRSISFDDLKHRSYEAFSPYERNTLEFCSDWLEGKKDFFQIETSGSTGVPKKIKMERSRMALSARLTCSTLRLLPNIDVLVCINTKYIGGLMMLVRCFENFMNPIIIEPNSNLSNILAENKFGFAAFVPLQLKRLLKDKSSAIDAISSIDHIIIGGAPLNNDIEHILSDLPNNIYHTFGMTETLSHIALRRLRDKDSLYVALDGVTFSTNDMGCLIIKSALSDIPLVTNDIVKLKSEKEFKWIGRIDNVINSGGIKISPEIIEKAVGKVMLDMGITRNFIIYGDKDKDFGEVVTLGVEGNILPKKIEDDLLLRVKSNCQLYSFPKKVCYASTFEYTSTGKVNRVKTKELF